ncbi:hypothetical protein E4T66_00555 [Sinimarinibacterium sp. CAU 1509]|uniref:hypothetical protein n=1 Tax=Sinimarinibacterium sp. CAU 1509 TaxID=2562283 RepID=UPI0010AD3E86|nr:hypothetical protein [Sinimarinibacterium sp. CAU 1509]TJY64769.1 hypothetical protein E4T66_00555 [Sinimarinibacterium sp. CAU 1509]
MRLCAAACIAFIWSGGACAGYVPRSALDEAVRIAAVTAKSAPDESTLAARLDAARLSAVSDPLPAEAELQQTLLRLREAIAPQAATRMQVEALTDYSPQTYTDALDDERARGGLTVPAFEIAATARGTLRRWDKAAHRAALVSALRRGDLEALRAIDDAAAWREQIAVASDAELLLLRSADSADPGVRSALALRLGDTSLARDVLRAPATPAGLTLLAALPEAFESTVALTLLNDPDLDSGYRSAARLAMSRLVWSAETQQALLAGLGDADGASSAQALARDPRNLPALRRIIADAPDDLSLRRALLALHWMEDAGASATLAAFSHDPAQPASLRAEVSQWLR